MKHFVITLMVFFSGVFMVHSQDTTKVQASDVPSVEIRTLDDKIVNARDILNDTVPVIVSFWATWCKPCIKELTAINDEMDTWKEEVTFRMVAVSVDDARTTHMVKNLVNSKGWTFEVYLDRNSDLKKLMNVAQPPHIFIIYKGRIVYQHTSYAEGDEEALFEELKKYR